ncbi:beta-1 4-mannosyltransferase egh [Biomphalaria pfeifferi]|uniref:Beta-1 4-mannosyltransferase egh n=1 Tax=Biomphalaria pfeifferi TaxID=112525 RepID=A0AAD8AZ24_BIOPF|nr:beta-1 4-mannosyltransferase egh [Biomphalaria pfeifferi]
MSLSSMQFTRLIKHCMSIIALMAFIYIGYLLEKSKEITFIEIFTELTDYSSSLVLVLSHVVVVIRLPFCVFNFLGLVFLNNFEARPKLQFSLQECPFLVFRVVTKGLYPELVKRNVQLNLQTCTNLGLKHFTIQVVSDISVNFSADDRCREITVPADYKTKNGSLFKARALQYALEPEVDILKPGDWVVHLDEETLLTKDALIGIINFVSSSEHSIGQGHITYDNGEIVNWITTLADSTRVGIDYGCRRFCMRVLHKPVFGFKGSFVVAEADVEKRVGFDYGPEGSIAEDCYFACLAYSKGISFGFVEGTMIEQSTFTVQDFIQQRHRWMHGIYLTALSPIIPVRYNLGPILLTLSSGLLPLHLFLNILRYLWALPTTVFLDISSSLIWGTNLFTALFGTLKTFNIHHYSIWKYFFIALATMACYYLNNIAQYLNSVKIFWMLKTTINHFHIVDKKSKSKGLLKLD